MVAHSLPLSSPQNDFMGGAPIKISDPVVGYRETVREKSSITCLAKSPNKHNRLFAEACPMDVDLQKLIEEGEFVPQPKDAKVQAKAIAEKFPEFDSEDVNPKKLWAFGPDGNGPNWLMDATRGVQFLNEIKESCVSGFQWGTRSGPLAQEMMRGVICKLLDVTLHADAIHRGQGQLMPCFRQVLFATIYTAQPTLMEPMYIADISCPIDETGSVYSTLALRRGVIVEEIPRVGTPMTAIRAHLPVNESFGFTGALRAATGGKAFPQCAFDHWAVMTGDPVSGHFQRGCCRPNQTHSPFPFPFQFSSGNKVFDIVKEIRKRKGLKEELPPLEEYNDKVRAHEHMGTECSSSTPHTPPPSFPALNGNFDVLAFTTGRVVWSAS